MMPPFKPWLLFALCLPTVAGPASPGQDRIRELLHQHAPTALVIQELDALIAGEPTCETPDFLADLLTVEPPEERVLLRVARRLGSLRCSDSQRGERLLEILQHRGQEI